MLYYTTYTIINIKKLYLKQKENNRDIKYNNPQKSVEVRCLAEQHVVYK